MSSLTEKIKINFQPNIFNEFIESFESLVDLFTILSFVLIASAFFFGSQKVQTSESGALAEFELREIIQGAAPLPALPDDIVIIFIAKENGSDIIQFTKKRSKFNRYYASKVDLDSICRSELQGFQSSNNINIVVLEGHSEPNYRLLYRIEKWLAGNGFNNVVINFQ